MGTLTPLLKPDSLIAAFENFKGMFEVSFSNNCESIVVSVTSQNKSYQKEFSGEELEEGKLLINIQRYIQEFTISLTDIYSGFALTNSGINNSYSVVISAKFKDNTTADVNFSGNSIDAIRFKSLNSKKIWDVLQTNSGIEITTNSGETILVVKSL